jgi:uncharacterized protein YjiK
MKGYFKSPPFYITVGILLLVGILTYFTRDKYYVEYTDASQIKIVNKWALPRVLEEVSGISYLDNERIACIQDEVGDIFIYNLVSEKIDSRINFAKKDDFEGLATIGNKAYILRSDGKIFEVEDITAENPKIASYDTEMSFKYDFEGLCYDEKNNRLLVAAKTNIFRNKNRFKPVYEFSLETKKLNPEPIYKLAYDNPIFQGLDSAGDPDVFRTSEIKIHPTTGKIYMLDGVIGKLLILNKDWKAEDLYVFNPDNFPQPEGLTFTPDGKKMYISNEGEWDPANILQVELSKGTKNDSLQKPSIKEPDNGN